MIVVVGSTGQVGTALVERSDAALPLTRGDLDLASLDASHMNSLLREHTVDAVVNCAAYTAVDRAESEPELARRINADAVGVMAEVCAELRVPFVTYSTDYVFAGRGSAPFREDDPTDPVNAYGASKLLGECRALEYPETSLVIRTSWVISGTHPNFVATMLRLTGEGRSLTVVADQQGRPTVARDLAAATMEALNERITGLLHVANEGQATWFELAQTSVSLAGGDAALIQPCSTEEYPTPAKRPAYSVLDTQRAASLGITMPTWQASLPALVDAQLSGPKPTPAG